MAFEGLKQKLSREIVGGANIFGFNRTAWGEHAFVHVVSKGQLIGFERTESRDRILIERNAPDKLRRHLKHRKLDREDLDFLLVGLDTTITRANNLPDETIRRVTQTIEDIQKGNYSCSKNPDYPIVFKDYSELEFSCLLSVLSAFNIDWRDQPHNSEYKHYCMGSIPIFKIGEDEEEQFRYSANIAEVILSFISIDEDAYTSGFQIHKITSETTAEGVLKSNGRMIKIYTDENMARKESLVLQKLETDSKLASRSQRLLRIENHPQLNARLKLLGLSQLDITKAVDYGYIPCQGRFIVISESELIDKELFREAVASRGKQLYSMSTFRDKNVSNLPEELQSYERKSKCHHNNRIADISELLGTPFEHVEKNQLVNRLMTLADLHSDFGNRFTIVERDLIGKEYSDKSVEEIVSSGSVGNKLLNFYKKAKTSQENVFRKRKEEGNLTFTHGDAKWDNWFFRCLGDYGSCKYSTEFKDLAKSLMDSEHLMRFGNVSQFMRFMETPEAESEYKLMFTKLLTNEKPYIPRTEDNFIPPWEELNSLLRNKHYREAALAFLEGNITWEDFKQFNKTLFDTSTGHSIRDQIVDEYIDLYSELRSKNGCPVQENSDLFKRNVYEALITECVRTMFYKSKKPDGSVNNDMVPVVRELEKIALHYGNKLYRQKISKKKRK